MAQEEGRRSRASSLRRIRDLGRWAAIGVLAVAVAEVFAVAAGIGGLTAPLPGGPPISGMAAVAFALAAIALLADDPAATYTRPGRNAVGVTVSILGAMALGDNVLDVWPGVGMPSIPASIGMVLFGVAVFFLDRVTRGGKRPSDVLGAAIGFIGFATLLGHVLGAPQLYRAAPDHGTSLAGAVCLCLLSVALLCARPEQGLVVLLASPTAGGTTARRLGLAAFALIPGLSLVVAVAQRLLAFEERTAFALVIAVATTLSLAVIVVISTDLDRSDQELARASAAEREMRAQLEATARAYDAISAAVARMEGSNMDPVLRAIAEQARIVSGAEYAAVGIASEDDPRVFVHLVTSGVPEEVFQALDGRVPHATGVLGDVALRGKSVRTCAVSEHPDARGMPTRHPPIKSLLGVPLVFAGSQIGSLFLGNKLQGDEFTPGDQRIIEMLAARAASALKAAQLREVEARAHERLQTVIDQMPEPLLIADAEGQLLHWNRAAEDARGYTDVVDERGTARVLDLRLPSGAPVPASELPIARALRRREAVTGMELLLKTREGTLVPVSASAAPLRDPDGQIRGAVALFDDVTVLKQLERMREEWTAVIAHDLRQPLNGIALHAQVLRRALGSGAPAAQLESIEHIRVAGLRQNRMIEDLLDATRIEASRLKLERRPLALPPFVGEILERMPEVTGHPVRLEAHGELPLVLIDASRIEQVMSNLLSNAAKYGEEGASIVIAIEQDGADVRVSVANEGKALTIAEITHLFTRFYRTPAAEAGPKSGLGLGLYISKGLVEAHGGRIWAESSGGRTSFHFTLPTTLAPSDEERAPADETRPGKDGSIEPETSIARARHRATKPSTSHHSN